MNSFECGCERGGDCTLTTMCAVQTVAEELEEAQITLLAVKKLAEAAFWRAKTAKEENYIKPILALLEQS